MIELTKEEAVIVHGRVPDAPVVSIVIPTYQEIDSIGECLDRIAHQSLRDCEILVADGMSDDGTREVVRARARVDPRIRLIDNPRRLQSAGLNAALSEAVGEYLVRLDARSFVDPDYVQRCVRGIEEYGAAVFGGAMVPVTGRGIVADGIALANRSAWGAGPARFHRTDGEPAQVETVYLGAFRTKTIRWVGGWSESVGVNEDYELNHRIRAAGGSIWFDPSLRVRYRPRATFGAVARQYFRYGRSKNAVMKRHRTSIRPRQVAPTLMIPIAVGAFIGQPTRSACRAAVAGHAAVVAVASASASAPVRVRIAAAIASLVMHWSWSGGFWFAFIRPFPDAGARR